MTWGEHLGSFLPDVMSWQLGWPYFLAAFVCGYLAGSIPFGVLVARLMNLGDLRNIGSGNIGATNVLRTGSKKAAALTLACDMAKGWIPVAIFLMQWGEFAAQLAGLGAFLGHLFPVWLRFQGGKGVAVFLGIILGLDLYAGLLCCAAWLVAAAAFRMSSLAALLMSLSAPVFLWLMGENGPIWAVIFLIILIWNKHEDNIRRILAGTEPKIGKS
ncbi:MAG: glycerol-3-phosphate 1-O-acyltransferase PlsY [Pseudomonadota bacterium]